MAICTECGKTIEDGKKFCTNCGKPVKAAKNRVQKAAPPVRAKQTAASAPKPTPAPKSAQAAPAGPPPGSPYAVMSMGSYVLASILMSIPVVGLIISIIWACGVCKNLNKRNYARAFLIFMLIGLVLSLVAYLLARWVSSNLWNFLPGSELFGTNGGLPQLFEMLRQLGNLVPSD